MPVMASPDDIAKRLGAVRDRIIAAAARSSRSAEAVRLVLASKTQPAEAVRAAYAAGARDFGENYVQEAESKRRAAADLSDVRWHMIGHLQRNKAAAAERIFGLIHSLDSAALAAALARVRPVPPVPVLIEVKLGDERTKNGASPDAVEKLIESVRRLVDVRGLMTIPPAGDDGAARRYFAALREMRDRLAGSTGLPLAELSMGMSNDFEIAIEEGSTIVRIGRAVFGERTR